MKKLITAAVLVLGACGMQAQAYLGERRSPYAAADNFTAGKPLEGLPNLDRPVYVNTGALVCSDDTILMNSRVAQMRTMFLADGRCVTTKAAIRVALVLPEDRMSYINDDRFGLILATFSGGQASVANVYRVWVSIADLKN